MELKPSKNKDECCYPFIFEKSKKCDFEILTDELCRLVGHVLIYTADEFPAVHDELNELQPKIYHLNGSIRGKCAIDSDDVQWLKALYSCHYEHTKEAFTTFILPRGGYPVPILNSASSLSKKIIRVMAELERDEHVDVDNNLSIFANLLCNYFFILTIVINKARGEDEIPFESKSYSSGKLRK